MIKVTRFKLYPNKEVEDKLFSNLRICSFVYNWCLEHNIWNDSVLPQLKEVYPDIKEVHSIVLQNVVHQIRDNIKALSELKKKGKRVGRLRHKSRHSMIFEQTGFKIDEDILKLSKIGAIPIVLSRPIKGEIKQIIIKHNKTNDWFASVVSETTAINDWFAFRRTYLLPKQVRAVGIDLNVSNFSTDSDGLVIEHPKNVKKAEKRLKRQQRKLSRKVKGSHNRKKQRRVVAKVHEKVENRRSDFLHKISRYYVDNYDLIASEGLSIAGMVHSGNSGLSKAILDASWGKFNSYVQYKAENAGKYAVSVIAKGTTQDCCICGRTVPKDLKDRTHSCPYCGSVMPRDYNSSMNIRRRGIEKVGWGTPEPCFLDMGMGKLNTLAEIRTSILDVNNPEQVFISEPRISRL
ncbi:MAG: IS200/IS605 family element transposase accessory protein TnpB [Candidatus Methanoperedens sp.]|nr:IS200/IS605 family element transposase accessory protein TnpB [Candidatus Methanoperedens sp.]